MERVGLARIQRELNWSGFGQLLQSGIESNDPVLNRALRKGRLFYEESEKDIRHYLERKLVRSKKKCQCSRCEKEG